METPHSPSTTEPTPSFWRRQLRPRTYVIAGVLLILLVLFLRAGAPDTAQTSEDVLPPVRLIEASAYKTAQNSILATGEVRAQADVTIPSEYATPVAAVYVDLGDTVVAGQPLVEFVHDDLDAQLAQAEATLTRTQASLDIQIAGAREEERAQAQLAVSQAEQSVTSAEATLRSTTASVETTLEAAYEGAAATASTTFSTALNALLTVADLQSEYLDCQNTLCRNIARDKEEAAEILLGIEDAGRFNRQSLLRADGGVREALDRLNTEELNPQELKQILQDLDTVLEYERSMLLNVRTALETADAAANVTDTDRTLVDTQRSAITAAISTLNATDQTIRSAEGGILGRAATSLDTIRYADHPSIISATSALAVSEASLESARQNLAIVESGARELDLAPARAAVLEAKASYQLIASRQRQAVVTAPFDGVIARLPARIGELVSPGQPVVTVLNADILEVTTYISAQDFGTVRYGTPATIDGVYAGMVTFVAPSVDPSTGKVEVEVAIQDIATIPVGSFVSVELKPESRQAQDLYVLPLSAVQLTSEGGFVYTINEDDLVAPQKVETGIILGDRIEVTSGLSDDTQFVSNVQGLSAGDEVEIN